MSVVEGYLSCDVLERYVKQFAKSNQVLEKKREVGACTCHYHLGDASLSAVLAMGSNTMDPPEENPLPLDGKTLCSVVMCTTNPDKYEEMLETLKYSKKALESGVKEGKESG